MAEIIMEKYINFIPSDDPDALLAAWSGLLTEQPKLRIRNAAEALGVPEGSLVAARVGAGVRHLRPAWEEALRGLEAVGPVMALTRNACAVHEKIGVYRNVEVHGPTGLVLDHAIDLRLFFARWSRAFAVEEAGRGEPRQSIQIFDAAGQAIHKIYRIEDTDAGAWEALLASLEAVEQPRVVAWEAPFASPEARPDAEVDVAGFLDAWEALEDTHDFFGLLRRFGVTRTQALRLGEARGLTTAVPTRTVRAALERAAAAACSIMVFVGNAGAIQIHTGPVVRTVPTGPWFNVLDPGFNLHLREDGLASAWIVRKPTRDGVVTSLEAFDAEGGTVAQLFGARKPGIPEDLGWRALAEALVEA